MKKITLCALIGFALMFLSGTISLLGMISSKDETVFYYYGQSVDFPLFFTISLIPVVAYALIAYFFFVLYKNQSA